MTINERAQKIIQTLFWDGTSPLKDWEFVAAELRAVQEEGKRDSIIEFCEGDRSMLAEYEQKAFAKGLLRAAEIAENGPEPLTSIRVDDIHGDMGSAYLRWVADRIRKEAGEL